MAGKIYTGNYVNGIVLSNAATQNPATIASTGHVTNNGTSDFGTAIYGMAGTTWRVTNLGTVNSAGTSGDGIRLRSGGTVTNGQSGSAAGLIEGSVNGVEIDGAAGAVVNFGTIAATGGNGGGVYLTAGGHLTNASLGVIRGRIQGVEIGHATGTVVNLGVIESTGTTSGGIFLVSGGTVTNGRNGATGGLIEAPGDAVAIGGTAGGVGTVTNFGTIKSTGTFLAIYLGAGGEVTNRGVIESSAGKGVLLATGGAVTNYGVIETHGTALATGVSIHGTTGAVVNFGTVMAGGSGNGIYLQHGGTVTNEHGGLIAGGGTTTGGAYSAVAILSGGRVLNYGTIKGTRTNGDGVVLASGGTVTNGRIGSAGGSITGTSSAIVIEGTSGAVTNFGTIENASTSRVAVYLAGGTVTNGQSSSTAALIESPTDAVLVRKGAGTITNFGTIESTASFAAIYLGAGGRVTNYGVIETRGTATAAGVSIGGTIGAVVNFGTIKGVVGLGVATGDTAGVTLTDSGRIIGTGGIAVQFGAGDDLLTIDPGAVFIGSVDGGGGSNKIVEGMPGTLAFSGISGFETIVLANGGDDMLTLTDANFAGVAGNTITVDGGNAGNTISAAGVAATDKAILRGGTGTDTLIAGQNATMNGGAGANVLVFTTPGSIAAPNTNFVTDFTATTDRIAFSNAGFDLQQSGASATPQPLGAALFAANSSGSFTSSVDVFAYDTKTGGLYYDAGGNGAGSSREHVATLTGHPTLSEVFFVS